VFAWSITDLAQIQVDLFVSLDSANENNRNTDPDAPD
jgi:hypothetical protein